MLKTNHTLKVETTSDGTPTLYREDIDEHYHSVKGALAESRHVYVDSGWRKAAEVRDVVSLFEVGFGTGMNAALTAEAAAEAKVPTDYYAVELYPLPEDVYNQIAEGLPSEHRDVFRRVNEAKWGERVEINPWFWITKIQGDFTAAEIPKDFDVVYYDAFAPEKQPEMWHQSIFCKLYESMRDGGCLTTYCAKGAIRRMLKEIGFIPERLAGPPGGKREILRARK